MSTYLEKWGSGVARIIEACKEQGVPEPTYEDRGGFIHIIFKRKSPDHSNDTQENKNGGQETTKVDRKDGHKTREAILNLIVANSRITSTQIVESLGINRSAVTRQLKKLQDDGVIKREGTKKGGQWIIIKK